MTKIKYSDKFIQSHIHIQAIKWNFLLRRILKLFILLILCSFWEIEKDFALVSTIRSVQIQPEQIERVTTQSQHFPSFILFGIFSIFHFYEFFVNIIFLAVALIILGRHEKEIESCDLGKSHIVVLMNFCSLRKIY